LIKFEDKKKHVRFIKKEEKKTTKTNKQQHNDNTNKKKIKTLSKPQIL